MLKKVLCSGLLVTGANCLPVHAEAWDFTYTGFNVTDVVINRDLGFQPDSFSGRFNGIDVNHDGVLGYSEVKHFTWDGKEYSMSTLPHPGCPYDTCQLNSFSFNLKTQELQFSGVYDDVDTVPNPPGEDFVFTQHGTFVSGDHYEKQAVSFQNGSDMLWKWTDKTAFVISAIPEPSGIAMSAAGLLLLMGRRRKHGSTKP